jgi:DNA polymerase-3 subunit delta'
MVPPVTPETGPLRGELARAVREQRTHGAYLFEGPPGTPAEECALWFARLLLCREPRDEPCEHCHSCALSRGGVGASQHPDFHAIRPEGVALRVDAVRGLQRVLGLAAHEGGRRVGVVLEADLLNLAAANALLKTLEEPSAGVVLILVARSAAALPATVRSRLTRVRFAAPSEDELRRMLEGAGFDPADARLAAALGGGSLASARRWAQTHLETARAFARELETLRVRPVSAVLDLAEGFRGSGAREQVLLFLDVHGAVGRARLRAHLAAGDTAGAEDCLTELEAAQRTRRELERRNLNPQLAIEALLLAER